MNTALQSSKPRRTIANAIAFGRVAQQYQDMRERHPGAKAQDIHSFIQSDTPLTFEQFQCEAQRGHSWAYTGSAYGGDDDSYHGEGRCYCAYCGADGDA